MDDPVSSADAFLFERFRFDRRGRRLYYREAGAQVAIGSRALDVLSVLIERAGDLVSKNEIMKAVWPETVVDLGNLTVQISALVACSMPASREAVRLQLFRAAAIVSSPQ